MKCFVKDSLYLLCGAMPTLYVCAQVPPPPGEPPGPGAAAFRQLPPPGGPRHPRGPGAPPPEGLNLFHLVNATSGGQTLYDSPPVEPASLPIASIQPFSGAITSLRRDPRGLPNGILLSGNRIIELSPGVFEQLAAYLRPGVSISGSGSRIVPPPGVVLAQNTLTIRPQTLTIAGQTYMVR